MRLAPGVSGKVDFLLDSFSKNPSIAVPRMIANFLIPSVLYQLSFTRDREVSVRERYSRVTS